MLIKFSVENWRSFRDKAEFNLIANGKEKQHLERVPTIKEFGFRLLPIAAIYGGNASGKSNLLKAIGFARRLVVEGTSNKGGINQEPFLLKEECSSKPSLFSFVFLIPSKIQEKSCQKTQSSFECYEYTFSVDRSNILEEKLIWIKPKSEKVLFDRKFDRDTIYDDEIRKDPNLYAILETTRNNQLFLTNIAGQNASKYLSDRLPRVYSWFENLTMINPDTTVSSNAFLWYQTTGQLKSFCSILSKLGTGIVRLSLEKADGARTPFPQEFLDKILTDVPDKVDVAIYNNNNRYVISKKTKGIEIKQLVSYHQGDEKEKPIRFNLEDDSDGTIRVIDLLPLFLGASKINSSKVFIIDELDRSLHTLLVRQLLESYLASCSQDSRSQIIFTTHDVLQMDQNLLRRDEMWITERNEDGSSELIPLSSYKEIRKDKSIRTSYLRGQLGGIPKLLLNGTFSLENNPPISDEEET